MPNQPRGLRLAQTIADLALLAATIAAAVFISAIMLGLLWQTVRLVWEI